MTKRKGNNPTVEASVHAHNGKLPDTKLSAKQPRSLRVKTGPATGSPEAAPASPEETPSASSTKKPAKSGKMSALDAAAKVLAESGQPMTCQEMIDIMARKNYWTSPGGRTPAATLYSAILRELKTKADQARFVKTGRGKFTLK